MWETEKNTLFLSRRIKKKKGLLQVILFKRYETFTRTFSQTESPQMIGLK